MGFYQIDQLGIVKRADKAFGLPASENDYYNPRYRNR